MFRTGEFSKIARVSKRLLQYYDEIGLFKPAHSDPHTGYRYYSAQQLLHLNRILALKDMGFTLDQIAGLLQAKVSDAEIHRLLLQEKAELEQRLRDDGQRLRRIEARLQQDQLTTATLDVVVKAVPAQLFLGLRAVIPSPAALLGLVAHMQQILPTRVDPRVLGPLAGIVYTDGFRPHNNDVEVGYLLKKSVADPIALSEEYVLRMREWPAVSTMATAIQTGGPDLVFNALGRIGHWIETHGYRMAGPYREIGLAFPQFGPGDDSVVEVQMPIEQLRSARDAPLVYKPSGEEKGSQMLPK